MSRDVKSCGACNASKLKQSRKAMTTAAIKKETKLVQTTDLEALD
jgi:hypothetical protein